jgi:hypothetical protein
MMMWLLLCPTILETRQCILIGLSVSVGVSLSDTCVRNGTSNGVNERESEQFKWFVYWHYSLGRYFGFCLPVYSTRLSEKERERRKWNIYSFRLWWLREKSFELCQTQQPSLSLSLSCSLLLLNSTEIERKRKGNQSSIAMWK